LLLVVRSAWPALAEVPSAHLTSGVPVAGAVVMLLGAARAGGGRTHRRADHV